MASKVRSVTIPAAGTALLLIDVINYFVLKPRHSGFFDTTLDTLLAPADCIVANTAADNDHALRQIETVLKGDVAASVHLTFRRTTTTIKGDRASRGRARGRE